MVTDYIAPLSFYPDSFTMMLCQTGIALAVFGILFYWYDVRQRDRQNGGFMTSLYNRTSRFSLTFYFLHYQLIGWTLAIVYVITGENRLLDLMGAWSALICGLAALVFLEVLIAFWERHGGRYSLEWILAVLTARFVRMETLYGAVLDSFTWSCPRRTGGREPDGRQRLPGAHV